MQGCSTKKLLFFCLCISLFCVCYSQNKTIDSLKRVLTTIKEDTNKIKTVNLLTDQLVNVGNPQEAIKYAEQGSELSEKLNFKIGLAYSQMLLGIIYEQRGDYPKALEYYFE